MNKMDNFIYSLGVMGKGMLGIFAVTLIIVIAITLLNKFSKNKD